MEPNLQPDVVGGWWFPEDASVDARRLTCSLRAACAELGVQFMWGEGCAADSLELGGKFTKI
jgi:thiazole synthase